MDKPQVKYVFLGAALFVGVTLIFIGGWLLAPVGM
jgi:hypothetical protein